MACPHLPSASTPSACPSWLLWSVPMTSFTRRSVGLPTQTARRGLLEDRGLAAVEAHRHAPCSPARSDRSRWPRWRSRRHSRRTGTWCRVARLDYSMDYSRLRLRITQHDPYVGHQRPARTALATDDLAVDEGTPRGTPTLASDDLGDRRGSKHSPRSVRSWACSAPARKRDLSSSCHIVLSGRRSALAQCLFQDHHDEVVVAMLHGLQAQVEQLQQAVSLAGRLLPSRSGPHPPV